MLPVTGMPGSDPQAVPGIRFGVTVTVRTPATSANLGPGFDSLGLALALYDEIELAATPDGGVQVTVEGEGAGDVPGDERHLVVRAVRAGLDLAGAGRPGLRLRCRNAIPHGRGLGSSAAAVAAGLVGARALLTDPGLLDDATLLRLATAFEGHPDNAAAALLGGFTVSWTDALSGLIDADAAPSGRAETGAGSDAAGPGAHAARQPAGEPLPAAGPPDAHAVRVPVHPAVRVVACVPPGELATSVARRMLPAQVPHADAAFNAARAALLVTALAERPDLLLAATADRLHQGQRSAAMPDSVRLVQALRTAGSAAVISGAGPTVLVFGATEGLASTVSALLGQGWPGWRAVPLAVDTAGTTIVTERSAPD